MRKICASEKELQKSFGQRARKIARRLKVLEDADNLGQVAHTPPERRHQLSGNRHEEFAVVIEEQWRIIFCADHEVIPRKPDGGIDLSNVTAIVVVDICEDYHR